MDAPTSGSGMDVAMGESLGQPADTVKQKFRCAPVTKIKHFESLRSAGSLIDSENPMTAAQKQHQFRVALCFALVYVFWGSTYLAIKIAVEHIPAALMGASRFLISGPLMLAW